MPESTLGRGLLAVAAAALADLAVFLIARAAGVPFVLGLRTLDSLGGVTWYFVIGVAAVAALAGVAFAAVVRRMLTPRTGATVFGWTVVAVAAASCVPLLALGLPAATTAVLALLHVVAGAAVLLTMLPTFRRPEVRTRR